MGRPAYKGGTLQGPRVPQEYLVPPVGDNGHTESAMPENAVDPILLDRRIYAEGRRVDRLVEAVLAMAGDVSRGGGRLSERTSKILAELK